MYSDRDKRAAPIKDILEVIRKSDASMATKEVTKKSRTLLYLYYTFIDLIITAVISNNDYLIRSAIS